MMTWKTSVQRVSGLATALGSIVVCHDKHKQLLWQCAMANSASTSICSRQDTVHACSTSYRMETKCLSNPDLPVLAFAAPSFSLELSRGQDGKSGTLSSNLELIARIPKQQLAGQLLTDYRDLAWSLRMASNDQARSSLGNRAASHLGLQQRKPA